MSDTIQKQLNEERAQDQQTVARRHRKKLHWWSRGSGIRLRIWMAVNILLLGALSYGVLAALGTEARGPRYLGLGRPAGVPGIRELLAPAPPQVPDKSVFSAPDGKYFGVSTVEAPWSASELGAVADHAGVRPTMAEYFVRWNADFDPKAVSKAYDHGTLPVLAWEPWEGEEAGHTDQPGYSLASIINGSHDEYLERFAKAVADQKWPVAIRFAHEMNGTWYPWSEQENGNKKGEYVQAWRHVHDLFSQAGADNVIWVWSPNILRPVPNVDIAQLYPGDDYVDWIGMVGYGTKTESKAEQTFGPTIAVLRGITKKPMLITETGREPSPSLKADWTTDFLDWLGRQPDVLGFIWFQRDTDQGGKADWRFDETPAAQQAFADGIRKLKLADGLG
ncbi:glycosyl hydrolase [Kitasatospora sp. NPDC049258]|uniref:glycoside hydrolase family 26 protein n=1 Tax=Kitasatospora sp. NPDC049258 TaxID=3155394 RepID=UPI0034366A8D